MTENPAPAVQALAPAVQQGDHRINVSEVKARTNALANLMSSVLQKDIHYGVIPGTPKPTLYKPGAEKIAVLFQLAPSFHREVFYNDEHLTIISTCTLRHQGSGNVIAEGEGMCTTQETKYAYRQATRKCPECGKATIIKGKQEYGGGWLCFAKKGGCGYKWPDGAKEIESQSEEREENPNLGDTYNTVLKMANKRAFVAAILFATAASDIFTQDIEDFPENSGQTQQVGNWITPAQHSRIAILLKEKNIPVESLKSWLKEDHGVESRKELTEAQASQLIQKLENFQPPAPAADGSHTASTSPPQAAGAAPDPAPADDPFPLPRRMHGEGDAADGAPRFFVRLIRQGFENAGHEFAAEYLKDVVPEIAARISPDFQPERECVFKIAEHYMNGHVMVSDIWPGATI